MSAQTSPPAGDGEWQKGESGQQHSPGQESTLPCAGAPHLCLIAMSPAPPL